MSQLTSTTTAGTQQARRKFYLGTLVPDDLKNIRIMRIDKLIEIDVNAVNGNVFPHEDHYWLIGNDSYKRRHSFLHVLDDEFQPVGKTIFLANGMEDHRVIFNQETYHVWCNYGGGAAMFCGELNSTTKTLDVAPVRPKGFSQKKQEKNWCPLVKNGELYVIYSMFPELVVLRMRDQNIHEKVYSGRSSYVHSWVAKNVDLSRVKHIGGGSNFIEYRGFFVGTFHVKYHDFEYLSCMVFITPDFVVRHIVKIDFGKSAFRGQRLGRLKKELKQDEENVFLVNIYRNKLSKVAFTMALFFKDDKFHISLGVNDLVTKVAIISREKIDDEIKNISQFSSSPAIWIPPTIEFVSKTNT